MPKKKVIKKSALSPTVLIAGGAGFIGSHLVDVFLANGARVLVLDNFSTGKELYVKDYLTNPNFALFNADINTGLPQEIESVDYVIHLAGLEEYLFSKELVNLDSLLTNSVGTKNLLDFSQKAEAKFLLVSSTDVYQGRMSQLEISDYFGKSTLDESKYMLTEAKRYAEALVWEYYKKQKIDVRVVRLPEVYGPRMNMESSGSMGNFLKDLIEGKNVTIFGSGDYKEYYLYISDAVSGVVKALFNRQTAGNIYSLIPVDPMSDVELAYLVKSLADRETGVVFQSQQQDSGARPVTRKPDLFNLKDLDWEAKVQPKEGIYRTLEWFGYHPNEFSFKPSKLIEEKKKPVGGSDAPWSKAQSVFFSAEDDKNTASVIKKGMLQDMQENKTDNELVFSLQGIKETEQIPAENKPSPTTPSAPVFNPNPLSVTQSAQEHRQVNTEKALTNVQDKKPGTFKLFGNIFKKPERLITQSDNLLPKKTGKLTYFLKNNIGMIAGIFVSLLVANILFIAVPLGSSIYNIKKGMSYLDLTTKYTMTLDSESVKEYSKKAYSHFYSAKKSFANSKWLFMLAGKKNLFDSVSKSVSSLAFFSQASYSLADTVKPFENLWEIMRPDTAQEIDPAIYENAKTKLSGAKSALQLAQADFKYVNPNLFEGGIREKAVAYGQALDTIVQSLTVAEPVLTQLPEVLGSVEPKKYMILFQNNNEVRATGGFIGSYGLITLEKGKIKSLEIDDIYNPDGQLDIKNIVTAPPAPIKEYLNEDKVHIRNANWNPDYPVAADLIKDLYTKVNDTKIDGVFAVDLYFVRELLRVTGPVFLTAYNEEITSENLYERTQFYSDFNYTNGSNQKKSFLTILGSKLLERFFSMSKEQAGSLAGTMFTALNERHLLLYFTNSPLNVVLDEQKWNGALVRTDGDYLQIVNSNLGGTKSDYYVQNKYAYKVSSQTRDGLLRAELKLNYKHTGVDNAWPGGPYTDYLRIYTQSGSKLTGAGLKYSGTAAPQDILKDIGVSGGGDYSVFSYGFKLAPGSEVEITFYYDLPSGLSLTKDRKEYSLYWQKQPGVEDDAVQFIFDKPFGMDIIEKTGGSVFENDSMVYSSDLSKDRPFYIKLR